MLSLPTEPPAAARLREKGRAAMKGTGGPATAGAH